MYVPIYIILSNFYREILIFTDRFRQLTKNTNRIPRTTGAFKAVVEAAGAGGKEVS